MNYGAAASPGCEPSGRRAWRLSPRNGLSAVRPDGEEGQYVAVGSWELDNDQALLISTARSTATYHGVALGNLWTASLDYETRTGSLSLDQADCSADGRCYLVKLAGHRRPSARIDHDALAGSGSLA